MLIRHTLLYLPAQCITPLIQFGSILIWAHLLPPATLGIVTLIIAMQELSFAAFFLWWSHYALRFIAGFKDPASRRAFLGTEMAAILISMVLQTIVIVPVLLLTFPEAMTASLLAVTLGFMVTRSLANYLAERARSETAIALYTVMQMGGPLFGLLIGLALIAAGHATPGSVLGGFAIAQAGSVIVAAWWTDLGRAGARPDRVVLRKALGYGVPVMLASMLALVAVNAPRFVVEHGDGLAAVGMFAVGYGLGLRASSFASMLVTAGAYPLLVRKMELEGLEAAYEQLVKNMTLVALAVVPVAFGLLAVNRSVVDLLVPPQYAAVTMLVLPLATLGGLLRDLRAHTTDQVFLVRSRPGWTTVVSGVDLVFAVVSSAVGLKLYGIAGAAAGPMISGAVTFSSSAILSRVLLGFRMPAMALIGIVSAAALMAAIVYNVPDGPGFVGLAGRIVLGMVIYATAVASVLPIGRHIVGTLVQAVAMRLSRAPARL